ncbi:DUF397 domain-containing protein [Kitasatospora sp. NBC_01287]|uniref:DUF397 domain-containing protein n=1 Tax=Kitasatospora sp. NBC_01287 TaxID=2903573 RepID=UPI00224D32AC|nr:DUF397 domain-containing protein [Kitasatospora sp. NBC_01287]MCX4750045.1 DUF397 domain-containing protein [Kitasatospora sp. NBC_01287]
MTYYPNADATGLRFHKSSYSSDDANCVECATGLPGEVAVRDSKDPAGPALRFSPQAWAAFAGAVCAGRLAVAGS